MTEHEVVGGVSSTGLGCCCATAGRTGWYPDVRDLPGGHVEPTEFAPAALGRECREELGIDVAGATLLTRVRDGEVMLSVFLVTRWLGEPANLALAEHDGVRWFTADDLEDLGLADDRYRPLLPDVLTRTDHHRASQGFPR
jgi:8-oxo-dGTP diphosphatase